MLGKPYGKKLKIVKLAYILQKPKFLIKIVLFLSFKNNATFKKNHNEMLDVVGYINIMERGGKRRTNLNTHYEKLFLKNLVIQTVVKLKNVQ